MGCQSRTAVVLHCGFSLAGISVISKEPFNRAERHAVISLASLYSFRMLGLFMVLPLLSVYAADMPGATPQMLGFALGAYGLTQALLQLPLGWLSDRVGRKPVVIAGLLVFIVGSAIAARAQDINGIVLGRFLQGCGAIAAALTAMAADYTRDDQRTKTMAIIGASVGMSFVLALVIGPVLAAVGGLAMVFNATALLGTVGLGIVIFVLPSTQGLAASGVRGAFEAEHLFGGGLPVLYFGIFVLHAILMATFLVVPKIMADHLGFPPDHHWVLYLGSVLLSLPPALLLMRRGRADVDPRRIILLAMALLAAGTLLALQAQSLWWLGVGMVMLFAGINTLEAVLPALVTRLAPSNLRGTASGIFSTSQFLGIFVGGVAGGYVLGQGGITAIAYSVVALALLWSLSVINLRLIAST